MRDRDSEASKTSQATAEEQLTESRQLSHYITVFNGSAGRVRYVIFIMVIFSVTVLVAQWNTTRYAWVGRRYSHLSELLIQVQALPNGADTSTLISAETGGTIRSVEELNAIVANYRQLRTERVLARELPGVGITFDINDLGLLSGLGYALLLTLLAYCVMREHENLVLVLFKVRRLHDKAGRRPDGESPANFLYHAVAMGQVFSSPPTLAQWRHYGARRLAHYMVFLIPTGVQLYIVVVNYLSLEVARAYGAGGSIMLIQNVLLLMVIALSAVVLAYEESAYRRWHDTFFAVNPGLRRLEALAWRPWLKRAKLPGTPVHKRFWRQAIARLDAADDQPNWHVTVSAETPLDGRDLRHYQLLEMAGRLEKDALKAASRAYPDAKVKAVAVSVLKSAIHKDIWVASADWGLHLNPAPAVLGPVSRPVRATRSFTQHLVKPPAVVFPLLCPVREVDWIEGWAPTSVISTTGFAETDCVFVTPATPPTATDAIWYITRHEPENAFVEMIKITPGVTACRLTIQLRPAGTGSEAAITYTHTSLGPEGDIFVAAFTDEYYLQFMRDWEARLNHFLGSAEA